MCFSAPASFATGAALLPAGLYCIQIALRKDLRYLPIALVPIFFGAQQLSEGFVWRGLAQGDPLQVRVASLVFLFFALALWPFWFSLISSVMERDPRRRRWYLASAILTSGWFWIIYYPLLMGPDSMVETRVVQHSIQYSIQDLEIYRYIPKILLRVVYLLSIAVPMMSGGMNWGRGPGIVLALLAILTVVVFNYAFISVWCFFAAILSGYTCYLFHHLPNPGASSPAPAHL